MFIIKLIIFTTNGPLRCHSKYHLSSQSVCQTLCIFNLFPSTKRCIPTNLLFTTVHTYLDFQKQLNQKIRSNTHVPTRYVCIWKIQLPNLYLNTYPKPLYKRSQFFYLHTLAGWVMIIYSVNIERPILWAYSASKAGQEALLLYLKISLMA